MEWLSLFFVFLAIAFAYKLVILYAHASASAPQMFAPASGANQDDIDVVESADKIVTTYKLPLGSDQLIGVVWPPKLGPMQTVLRVPDAENQCGSPYALVYGDRVVTNQCRKCV